MKTTALLYAALGASLAFAADGQPAPLTPGLGIERELRGGETHQFLIRSGGGQLIHVMVDQQGIDARVSLVAPGGAEIALSDFPNADWGPEVIAVIAESAGDYTLTVAAPDPTAAVGKYAARLVALRDATPEDHARAAAERSVGNAERLRRVRTVAARSDAIVEYDKALSFFEASGERYRVGLIVNAIGLMYAQSGDMRNALARYERAIRAFDDIGDRRGQAIASNNLGGAYDVLGDLPRAHEYYQRALPLFRSQGARSQEANTLSNIGKLYHDQADWQHALEYYRQALPVLQQLQQEGDQRREATVLGNMGSAYSSLRDDDTARDYFSLALARWRASGDPIGQATALRSLGFSYLLEERYREALGYFEQALVLYRTGGDRRGEGLSLNFLGVSQAGLGESTKALDVLQQSVEILRAAGDRRSEAVALGSLARVLVDSSEPAKALESAGRALAGFRAIGDRDNEAATLLTLADAQRNLGHLVEARSHAEEGLGLVERVRAGTGAEQTRASYFGAKQDFYSFTTDLLMDMHQADAALETSERARARSLVEILAESGAGIRQGIDQTLLERERDLSNQLNAKGARLLPLLGQTTARVAALQEELRNVEREYQDLETEIRKSSPRYASLTQPHTLTVKQIQEELLDSDTLLLEYALGAKRSFLWVVGKATFAYFALPARDAIDAQARAVYELLTARTVYVRGESPAAREARIATADADLVPASQRLSDLVIGPAADVLGNKRLVIVADGALQRLPFAMLPVAGSKDPLIASHEIVTLPSASALAVLRKEITGRKPAPKTLAVFADPVFDRTDPRAARGNAAAASAPPPDLSRILAHVSESAAGGAAALRIPRLPFTLREAQAILRVAPDPSNLRAFDFDASRATAISGVLSEYRYLHFATHGYLDTERPNLSALVLSQLDRKGQPLDGFLRAGDIYNSRLAADLVVLSACQTGLGKEVRGEGLMGLTRAFLYAGAPRVVVSLWNVNDRATADLMAALYRRMLRDGDRPAAALRAAQLEIGRQKRWASPYYWAAFIEQGEWN